MENLDIDWEYREAIYNVLLRLCERWRSKGYPQEYIRMFRVRLINDHRKVLNSLVERELNR